MLLSQKIEHLVCHSMDAQKTIGTFLLEERQRLKSYTMQDIAERTYTSKPTLTRFSKKLGFNGWNEFLTAYLEEVKYLSSHVKGIDANTPFKKGDKLLDIAGKLAAVKQESCQETLGFLDETVLQSIIEILSRSRRIALFGLSVNQYMGQLFQHKMVMIGRSVEIITQSEARFLASSLKEQDCAILISYSGNDRGRLPTSLLDILKSRKVPMIAITSMGDNMLRSNSDYVLTIASRERLYTKIGSFATEASIMLLLDILYSGCFEKNYEENFAYKTKLSRQVESRRYSTADGIQEI